jgi:hypothetical protein
MTPFVAAKLSPASPLGKMRKGAFVAKNQQAEVELNRRAKSERRAKEERRKQEAPVVVERRQTERRAKVQRRRQIDPTTCEREYNQDEIEFMHALDEYKRASGRMFPTCSEILEVIRNLGYVRLTQAGSPLPPAAETDPVEPSEAL